MTEIRTGKSGGHLDLSSHRNKPRDETGHLFFHPPLVLSPHTHDISSPTAQLIQESLH